MPVEVTVQAMKISKRSKFSLCQFLIIFELADRVLLLGKYEFETDEIIEPWQGTSQSEATLSSLLKASPTQIGDLLQELARTHGSMRTSITPRYRFDERWTDIELCLELDGYAFNSDQYGQEPHHFVPIEPDFEGAHTIEDDLTKELNKTELPDIAEIMQVLEKSANAYIRQDFNGCLGSARVVLQTLATSMAKELPSQNSPSFESSKWGSILAFLRESAFITVQEEKCLAGVYGLISQGSHVPIGFTEQEFARLGRSLALSLCYFLAKSWNESGGHR